MADSKSTKGNWDFTSSLTDLGTKHAKGQGHSGDAHAENKEPDGFFGTISDMGEKDAKGV